MRRLGPVLFSSVIGCAAGQAARRPIEAPATAVDPEVTMLRSKLDSCERKNANTYDCGDFLIFGAESRDESSPDAFQDAMVSQLSDVAGGGEASVTLCDGVSRWCSVIRGERLWIRLLVTLRERGGIGYVYCVTPPGPVQHAACERFAPVMLRVGHGWWSDVRYAGLWVVVPPQCQTSQPSGHVLEVQCEGGSLTYDALRPDEDPAAFIDCSIRELKKAHPELVESRHECTVRGTAQDCRSMRVGDARGLMGWTRGTGGDVVLRCAWQAGAPRPPCWSAFEFPSGSELPSDPDVPSSF